MGEDDSQMSQCVEKENLSKSKKTSSKNSSELDYLKLSVAQEEEEQDDNKTKPSALGHCLSDNINKSIY